MHGCVIANIAGEHAHNNTYGQKGGPYNDETIKSDVDSFIGHCGG